ncbi:gamma-glutamyltransferase [Microvirga thermotolerans]|uniref:Glutathione hydrolase proenzyme n=1 Tax=Microvirga thermotolerans TaxID=2651334 RepID=A0A5P9JSW4_9HYPH|nr:gamma-glutamyltransferase [Microvirga thermotolerans]QFU15503.1 gamma-glutamyltransferase [Microvirga thermotolerans]
MTVRASWWLSLAGLGLMTLAPLAPPVLAQPVAPSPEAPTGRIAKGTAAATKDMVAAANPLAAQAGREILAAGGSAVDAAVAVQLVLNLVEPQSSGIGGGAFMVFWDGKSLTTLDGRETAPAAAKPERFLGPDGKPMKFYDAVVGGRSVGVPGTLRLLEEAHRRWGKLPWKQVIEPAVRLAEEGFAISPRLNGLLSQEKYLANDPVARAYFFEADGKPKAVGTVLKNPAFAKTLRAVAEKGADAFYTGEIAEDIVATVTGHPTNPGDITLDDLKAYRVVEREPVCGTYRAYRVCGMGPPSSGGIAVQQILGILETRDMAALKPGPEAVHWLSEAGRLAFADRALYVADPAFVNVPVKGLVDPGYLRSRAALIDPGKSMGKAKPGEPPFQKTFLFAPSEGIEFGTSHMSIVDRDGNAVSMTTTIEDGFGSRLMTRSGFLLNNELTDFSFTPVEDGKPVANRVEAGKRPRSSMAPTIVFDRDNRLYAVVGSPGGSLIINYVAKTLVGLLDWKLDPQTAADLPNVGSRNGPTELEAGTEAEAWKAGLEAKGHEVKLIDQNSGIHAILVTPKGLDGGADSRREGVAIGND